MSTFDKWLLNFSSLNFLDFVLHESGNRKGLAYLQHKSKRILQYELKNTYGATVEEICPRNIQMFCLLMTNLYKHSKIDEKKSYQKNEWKNLNTGIVFKTGGFKQIVIINYNSFWDTNENSSKADNELAFLVSELDHKAFSTECFTNDTIQNYHWWGGKNLEQYTKAKIAFKRRKLNNNKLNNIKIEHQMCNILTPISMWRWHKTIFQEMDECPFGDLFDEIARINQTNENIDDLLNKINVELGVTLDLLHKNGFYHGDIKPENIFGCVCNGVKQWYIADCEDIVHKDEFVNGSIPLGVFTPYYINYWGDSLTENQYRLNDFNAYFLIILTILSLKYQNIKMMMDNPTNWDRETRRNVEKQGVNIRMGAKVYYINIPYPRAGSALYYYTNRKDAQDALNDISTIKGSMNNIEFINLSRALRFFSDNGKHYSLDIDSVKKIIATRKRRLTYTLVETDSDDETEPKLKRMKSFTESNLKY